MPDQIQVASSGRAKCRGCGRSIAAKTLRFGEGSPNPYGEGEAFAWFHLACAALMRPEKLLPALEATDESLEDRRGLEQAARFGIEHHRLPRLVRVERATSGRSHCRACRELIAKGEWRAVLQLFEEGRATPIGTIHLGCAQAYFGTVQFLDRLQLLMPDLGEPELSELASALEHQRPGLVKTHGDEAEDDSKLRSSGG